jgi:hypothetical protein
MAKKHTYIHTYIHTKEQREYGRVRKGRGLGSEVREGVGNQTIPGLKTLIEDIAFHSE